MSETADSRYQVFLSYSSQDRSWADAACAALEERGPRCWIAPRDITPGTEWGAAIIDGIDRCKVMVLIFSSHANNSVQVRREVERAISKGLAVLPLRVEDVRPAGAMEYALSNTHWLDAFQPPFEERLRHLVDAVEALLGMRPAPASTSTSTSSPTPTVKPPSAEPAEDWPAPARPARRLSPAWLAAGVAALMLMLMLAAGAALALRGGKGANPPPEPPPQPPSNTKTEIAANPDSKPTTDADGWIDETERFQGDWVAILEQTPMAPGPFPKDKLVGRNVRWGIQGHMLTTRRNPTKMETVQTKGRVTFRTRGDKSEFDYLGVDNQKSRLRFIGIYEFQDGILRVCFAESGGPVAKKGFLLRRPETFPEPGERGVHYLQLKRVGD